MALIIVISTGDFQIRWNVLHCRSVEEKVENGLLGKVIFIITISPVMIVFCTLERYPFATPIVPQLSKCVKFEAVLGVLNDQVM